MLKLVSIPVHLSNRKDYLIYKKNTLRINSSTDESVFVGEESHRYCFPFTARRQTPSRNQTKVNITSITLPDGKYFNTGSSLDRWSKKRPRLKSANLKSSSEGDSKRFDETEFDIANLINQLGEHLEEDSKSENDSLLHLEYGIHSDIEELILRSQREKECEDNEKSEKPHKHRKKNTKKKDKHNENHTKKKMKKLKKTIKFSISKPPSPETEQVIRVDVVSNMTVEESDRNSTISELAAGDKGISVRSADKSLPSSLICDIANDNLGDEDFIVKCKKLALNTRCM